MSNPQPKRIRLGVLLGLVAGVILMLVADLVEGIEPGDRWRAFCIAMPAVGAVFTAVLLWLTVRIVNRRERWAKWTAVAVVALPVLYVLSSGPTQMLAFKRTQITIQWPTKPDKVLDVYEDQQGEWWNRLYAPLIWSYR
jgi:hypothetical protein